MCLVIPAIVGCIKSQSMLAWTKKQDPISKITRVKRAEGVNQAVEYLPHKHKALKSNSNPTKKKFSFHSPQLPLQIISSLSRVNLQGLRETTFYTEKPSDPRSLGYLSLTAFSGRCNPCL
jgi:hypothetical protein